MQNEVTVIHELRERWASRKDLPEDYGRGRWRKRKGIAKVRPF